MRTFPVAAIAIVLFSISTSTAVAQGETTSVPALSKISNNNVSTSKK